VAPVAALAHPTDQQILESLADRRACESGHGSKSPDGTEIDPARLGMTEAALRAHVAGLRRDDALGTSPETDALQRWSREVGTGTDTDTDTDIDTSAEGKDGDGDVVLIQYELWQGRVYRIRWRLAPAFERPIFDELAERGRFCLGTVDLDQTFEAEPGSAEATLRRVVWTHESRRIELRQLHPLGGGPVYLSVTDLEALRAIGAAERAPFPDPSRSAPWWTRSLRPPKPADPEERARLGRRFLALIGEFSH
jgi:hypothetical protein